MTQRRLIEEAFPLKAVSEDAEHEKNVRHGHIKDRIEAWTATNRSWNYCLKQAK